MKKIYLTLLIGVLLVGTLTAGIGLSVRNTEIDLTASEKGVIDAIEPTKDIIKDPISAHVLIVNLFIH